MNNLQIKKANQLSSRDLQNGTQKGSEQYKKAFDLLDENKIESAFLLVKEGADLEHPGCLKLMGDFYQYGVHVEKNFDIAIYYYESAIDKGYTTALFDLGRLYYLDFSDDETKKIGIDYISEASVIHDVTAATNFLSKYGLQPTIKNDAYSIDDELKKDYDEEFKDLILIADDNNINGIMLLYTYYLDMNSKYHNYQGAFYWANRAQSTVLVQRYAMLAVMYQCGLGCKKNIDLAVDLYKKGIIINDLRSIFQYGVLLFEGDEVRQDKELGLRFIRQAASLGDIEATNYLKKHNILLSDEPIIHSYDSVKKTLGYGTIYVFDAELTTTEMLGKYINDLKNKLLNDLNVSNNLKSAIKNNQVEFKGKFLYDCLNYLEFDVDYHYRVNRPYTVEIYTGRDSQGVDTYRYETRYELIEDVEEVRGLTFYTSKSHPKRSTYYETKINSSDISECEYTKNYELGELFYTADDTIKVFIEELGARLREEVKNKHGEDSRIIEEKMQNPSCPLRLAILIPRVNVKYVFNNKSYSCGMSIEMTNSNDYKISFNDYNYEENSELINSSKKYKIRIVKNTYAIISSVIETILLCLAYVFSLNAFFYIVALLVFGYSSLKTNEKVKNIKKSKTIPPDINLKMKDDAYKRKITSSAKKKSLIRLVTIFIEVIIIIISVVMHK